MKKKIILLLALSVVFMGELYYSYASGYFKITKNTGEPSTVPVINNLSEMKGEPTIKTDNSKKSSISTLDYNNYLVKIDDYQKQIIDTGKAINSKEDFMAALVDIINNQKFSQPGPVYGESWEAGITFFEFNNGFALSNLTFFRLPAGGDKTAKVYENNYLGTRDGKITFLGLGEIETQYPKREPISGYGLYWDWKKIMNDQYILGLTTTVKGSDIKSADWADQKCQEQFGPEWLWVDNAIYVGHGPVTARLLGELSISEAWVQAYGENWECYEKGINDYPNVKWSSSNAPVNYPDKYGGGLVAYLQKSSSTPSYIDVAWWGDMEKTGGMIGSNYELCTQSLPLLCIKSLQNTFYQEREARKQSVIKFRADRDAATAAKLVAAKKSAQDGNLNECETYTKDIRAIGECQLEAIKLMDKPSADICKQIQEFNNVDLIAECHSFFGVINLNVSLCASKDCFDKVQRTLKDANICDKLSADSKYSCYMAYIDVTGDSTICGTKSVDKMICFRHAAIFHKDKKLCDPSDTLCECSVDGNCPDF